MQLQPYLLQTIYKLQLGNIEYTRGTKVVRGPTLASVSSNEAVLFPLCHVDDFKDFLDIGRPVP